MMKEEQKFFFYYVNGGLAKCDPLDFLTKESLPKERVWANKSNSIFFQFLSYLSTKKAKPNSWLKSVREWVKSLCSTVK